MSRFDGLADAWRRSPPVRWYYGRERYEQKVISGLLAVVVIAVLWAGVWKPVADWQTVQTNRQHNAQQLYDWLKANEQAARTASRTNQPTGARSLLPIVSKAADAHELRINRVQPESNGVISVVMQTQSFDQIVAWLAQLEENNGVSVERASFDGDDTPGYVNANLRLN